MGARELSGVLPYDGITSHQAWLKHLTRLASARDWDDEAKLRSRPQDGPNTVPGQKECSATLSKHSQWVLRSHAFPVVHWLCLERRAICIGYKSS